MYNIYNIYEYAIEPFFKCAIHGDKINIASEAEFTLATLFNFKNISLNYNPGNTLFSTDFNYNLIVNWYNAGGGIKNDEVLEDTDDVVDTLHTSVILDYYYYLTDVYCHYFNFSSELYLDSPLGNYSANMLISLDSVYKFLPMNFFENQLVSYSSWALLLIYLIFLYFILIWVYLFITNKVNTVFKNEKVYDDYSTTISYLVESEKELGSLDDLFIGISILITMYGWFFFGTIFFNFFHSTAFSHIYIGLPLFFFIILGMPSNLILDYGTLFPVFLRGSSNTTIFTLEFIYDILAVGVMYTRLVIQNIRLVLMFFAFFECYEFFFNYTFIIKNFYFYDTGYSVLMSFFKFLPLLLNFIILYIYTVGHLVYMIISHFIAYLVLIFWFFSFLYTTFLEEKLEVYFKVKRN